MAGALEGGIETTGMARLRDAVDGIGSEVSLSLQVGRDEIDRPIISGRASVTVSMRCERCLAPANLLLDAPFAWCFIEEGGSGAAPEDVELIELPYEGAPLADLVEDELLLALPLVATHPSTDDCDEVVAKHVGSGDASTASESTRQSPFAALEALKKRQ